MFRQMDLKLIVTGPHGFKLLTWFSRDSGYLMTTLWQGETIIAEAFTYWQCSEECRRRLNRTFSRLQREVSYQ